jgi:hypothetical protein
MPVIQATREEEMERTEFASETHLRNQARGALRKAPAIAGF